MADWLVLELDEGREAAAGIVPSGGGRPEEASRVPFAWPLSADDLEDLRWYLEDYLRAPFGVWEGRGLRVQDALLGWGDLVFGSVLGGGPARDVYQQARDKGLEVVIRSAVPWLLGLPWELMRDAAGPVALAAGGISRSVPAAGGAGTLEVPGGRLRVLMVISRPGGTSDVGYQMVARPLLERLDAIRGQVSLTVLRPPTFEALRQAVTQAVDAGSPYHVVHFDGHGVMPSRSRVGADIGKWPTMMTGRGEGMLAFEQPGGGRDLIGASKVAAALTEGKVPVAVLNACQSGALGKELEASIATGLLRAGCAAVVGMAYRVYAVAAAEFMATFYEAVFAGASVGQAVAAGRRRLFAHDERPSPKGNMPLADWLVPVHYLRQEVRFPQVRAARPATAPPLDVALDQIRAVPLGPEAAPDPLRDLDMRESHTALDPVGSFIGRDALFFELEVAARQSRVVILHGVGGTGKTELAKAFGRWWRDTGGIDKPEWVFWHSFEPGIPSSGLNGVVANIGLALFGADFAGMGRAEQRSAVTEALDQRRMLLILDNFETVRSMPDPASVAEPLNDAGCRELRDFLIHVARHGRSAVIVTSRTAEDWLGDFPRVEVGGLAPHEASAYAGDLLAPFSAAGPRRKTRAFGELLAWLDGHPLSMRLILPSLNVAEPEALLAGLRGIVPLPGDDGISTARANTLPSSVTYSFSHLAVNTQRLLLAACLFHSVVDAATLGLLSEQHDAPRRFRDADIHEWLAALEAAARVGLLTRLDRGMYRIHPALPSYLAARWRQEDLDDYEAARDSATYALLKAHSTYCIWLDDQISSGDAARAYAILDLQRHTFGNLLSYALDHAHWENAQDIIQTLSTYWTARGLDEEADEWCERSCHATTAPDGRHPDLDSLSGALWLFSTGSRAGRQLSRGRLDSAEKSYRQMLAMLQPQPSSPDRERHLAVVYHQLGAVAHRRRRLDEAKDFYRKSQALYEDLGDQQRIAMGYHDLGLVAEGQGLLDEADDWSRRSLASFKELGDRPHTAASYGQLGWVAQRRGQLDAAEDWYQRALAVHEDLGDLKSAADICHQLGTVAYLRWRLADAEDWHRRSLAIYEDLAIQPSIAMSFHQLGAVALHRGQLDEAADWHRRSLAIHEDLGDRASMAAAYHQLGLVALLRAQTDDAEGWFRRSLAIYEDLGDRPHIAANDLQLGSVEYLRRRLDDAEDWYRKSKAIYEDLGDMPGMADIYHQLGMAAHGQERLEDAEDWYRKSLAIREALGDYPGMAPTFWQLSVLAEDREQHPLALTWMLQHLALSAKFARPGGLPVS